MRVRHRPAPLPLDAGERGWSVTEGTDAQAEVSVRLSEQGGRAVTAKGADPDTLVASAKAYLGALNKLTARRHGAMAGAGRRRIHSTDTI